jgi:hypothetical protein
MEKDLTHECVTITFKCEKCGAQFRRTYEFSPAGKEKRQGFYRRHIRVKAKLIVNHSFALVEQQFDAMPNNGYKFFKFNCSNWARQFLKSLY